MWLCKNCKKSRKTSNRIQNWRKNGPFLSPATCHLSLKFWFSCECCHATSDASKSTSHDHEKGRRNAVSGLRWPTTRHLNLQFDVVFLSFLRGEAMFSLTTCPGSVSKDFCPNKCIWCSTWFVWGLILVQFQPNTCLLFPLYPTSWITPSSNFIFLIFLGNHLIELCGQFNAFLMVKYWESSLCSSFSNLNSFQRSLG